MQIDEPMIEQSKSSDFVEWSYGTLLSKTTRCLLARCHNSTQQSPNPDTNNTNRRTIYIILTPANQPAIIRHSLFKKPTCLIKNN